jgi:hypothetical protein
MFLASFTVWAAESAAGDPEENNTVNDMEANGEGWDTTFWDVDLDALNAMMMYAPISFSPDNGDFYIAGQQIIFSDGLRPVFDDTYDELFIPLRALAEAIGAEVAWAADTATVTIVFMGNSLNFKASDTLSGMPVLIINNRVYVPSLYLIDTMKVHTYIK